MADHSPPVYVQPARNSTMAIVSLIAGIAGLFVVPVVGSIVAVITGHMAKREIRESGGQLSGDGLATAGLILGYIGVGFAMLGICIAVIWLIFALGFLGIMLTESSAIVPLLFL